jgi:two-component system response regulator HydG
MSFGRILVVDDEKEILVSCRKILERAGYEVSTATEALEALNLLKASRFDLFFVDLKMPRLSGMDALSLARTIDPSLMIVMFTAYARLETAVEAVKRGAFDYLAKPFTSDQLCHAAEQAIKHKRLVEQPPAADVWFDRILGKSEAMQKLFGTLQKVMRSNANILILGETGTGKELFARTIHEHSLRRHKSFVAVDCAALPENLLESELFGHEKGAFTGADRSKLGLLELAHSGTLFLDEIGELSPSLQAKLLRTLQERELRRVGGDKVVPVDIRVIAATSRDLRAEIASKNFREELYYRLNVVAVQLPALRDRREDIPLLANHFLQMFASQHQRPVNSLSAEATEFFLTYEWPGNVRELQNVIQHAVLMSDGESVEGSDLPDYLQVKCSSDLSFQSMREKQAEAVEKSFLVELLSRHRGNVSEAAAEARMTRKMVYRLLQKFALDVEEFRRP